MIYLHILNPAEDLLDNGVILDNTLSTIIHQLIFLSDFLSNLLTAYSHHVSQETNCTLRLNLF